jgi:hypothetical protein
MVDFAFKLVSNRIIDFADLSFCFLPKAVVSFPPGRWPVIGLKTSSLSYQIHSSKTGYQY